MNSITLDVALHANHLWTGVFIPLVASIGVAMLMPKQFLRYVGITLLLLPLGFLTSWWDAGGLHTAPAYVVGVMFLAFRNGGIQVKEAPAIWAAFWMAGAIVDASFAWSEYPGNAMWFGGIGGDGLQDGLVTVPILMTAMVFSLQRMAHSKFSWA